SERSGPGGCRGCDRVGFVWRRDGDHGDMNVGRRRFCGGLGAPRRARRAVREQLGNVLSERKLGDVELLVSELATNSVRHARCDEDDEWALKTSGTGDGVRVSVS